MFLAIANSISSLIKPYISKITSALAARSDYYENIKGTNNILFSFGAKLLDKASIVLTPTAYSDGSLNTVIPPYQVLPQELVTNGTFDSDSDWVKGGGWTISNGTANANNAELTYLYQTISNLAVGKKYSITYTITSYTSGNVVTGIGNLLGNRGTTRNSVGTYTEIITFSINTTFNYFGFLASDNFTGSIDNVSVKEIQEADFDFSRGSSATRVNEKGLIEDVQILSGNLVQNGDFEEIGSELITNGNFDTDSDWIPEIPYVTLSISNGIANVFSTQAFRGVYQPAGITAGKIYKATITYKSNDDIRIYVGGSSFSLLNSSTDFTTETSYIKASGNSNIYVLPTQPNQTIEIDNVSVKEVGQNWTVEDEDANNYVEFNQEEGTVRLKFLNTSPLTALTSDTRYLSGKKYKLTVDVKEVVSGAIKIDSGGVSQTYNSVGVQEAIIEPTGNPNISFYRATADVDITLNSVSLIEITDDTDIPRIDYTSGQGALLLEPQRTNYVFPSNDFSSWSVSGGGGISITPNYGISPDGTQNSSRTDFSNGAVIYKSPNRPQGAYVFSVFAKNIEGGGSVIQLRVDVPASFTTRFDLSNGTIVSSDNDDAKIEYYGNGWYRCIIIQNNDSIVNTVIGEGTTELDCELFGGMLEEGSYATSYLKTEGSTVTRSADVANNSGNADLFNDSEGVLYAEIAALADDSTYRFISISDGSSSNRVFVGYRNASNSIYVLAGTATAFIPHNITNVTKIAVKYKSGDTSVFIDGFEVVSKTDTYTLSGLNKLAFNSGTGSPFYGNTKELAVFKEALTDAELESLTSWISFVEMATDLEYTIE